MTILSIALGGFLGAILRYLISVAWNKHQKPIGTWIANISGSLLLGLFVALKANGTVGNILWSFLGIGLCGSYTTFSTFGVETLSLIQANKLKEAILYVTSSVILSIASIIIVFILINGS